MDLLLLSSHRSTFQQISYRGQRTCLIQQQKSLPSSQLDSYSLSSKHIFLQSIPRTGSYLSHNRTQVRYSFSSILLGFSKLLVFLMLTFQPTLYHTYVSSLKLALLSSSTDSYYCIHSAKESQLHFIYSY